MKSLPAQTRIGRTRGHTLAELMVTTAIFSFAILGAVYCQIFGLRQDQMVNSKSGACEQARVSFNQLANDIRAAKLWQVGNGNDTTFTAIPLGTAQQGNALQLNLSTDTNTYYVYYFLTNSGELRRRHTGTTDTLVLAQFLTNRMYFRAETPRGDLQYDLTHKGVINVAMEFAQYQYPLTHIGTGYLYNYYKLEMRAASHVPQGP